MTVESSDNALKASVAKFMSAVPEGAYDHTVARVQMTIQFDYSDKVLKEAFAGLLASLRRGDPIPTKKDELDAHLKQLAAARLYRIFGTVRKAQDHLADCDYDLPYKDDAGWSKARTATKKLCGVKSSP